MNLGGDNLERLRISIRHPLYGQVLARLWPLRGLMEALRRARRAIYYDPW